MRRTNAGHRTVVLRCGLHCAIQRSTVTSHHAVFYDTVAGPAEVDNDWSGRTSGFYGRYFQKEQKEAQKDYRVSSGVLLK